MESQVNELVEQTWAKFQKLPSDKRLLIAVSGIPGSGKTTLATTVTKRFNALHDAASSSTSSSPVAGFVPMDGYHLSRAQLSAMPDPEHAHARRGAAFTFDAPAYLSLIQRLRAPITASTPIIHAPSFDHATKDPVVDDISIPPSTRLLVFEGNYLSLGKGEWKEAAELMDELWFVDVDFDVARKRLIPRHVKAGIARDEEEAGRRADENDLVNGIEIVEGRLKVDRIILSREDDKWKPDA